MGCCEINKATGQEREGGERMERRVRVRGGEERGVRGGDI
jgi:hypothetical protein